MGQRATQAGKPRAGSRRAHGGVTGDTRRPDTQGEVSAAEWSGQEPGRWTAEPGVRGSVVGGGSIDAGDARRLHGEVERRYPRRHQARAGPGGGTRGREQASEALTVISERAFRVGLSISSSAPPLFYNRRTFEGRS